MKLTINKRMSVSFDDLPSGAAFQWSGLLGLLFKLPTDELPDDGRNAFSMTPPTLAFVGPSEIVTRIDVEEIIGWVR